MSAQPHPQPAAAPAPVSDLRLIPGGGAFVLRHGNHCLTIDRPDGYAGGENLGFRGSQLLSAALTGCLANSLQEAAHEHGVTLTDVRIATAMSGSEPDRLDRAVLEVVLDGDADAATLTAVWNDARAIWTVGLSLAASLAISVDRLTIKQIVQQ